MCQRCLRHRNDGWPEFWLTEERRPMAHRVISADLVRLMDRAPVEHREQTVAIALSYITGRTLQLSKVVGRQLPQDMRGDFL